jgi:hypothetical protein
LRTGGGRFPFGWAAVAVLFFIGLLTPSASANTSIFSDSRTCTAPYNVCQALSFYGVLKGANSNVLTINGSNTPWTLGDIGVGSGTDLTKTGSNTATIIDFADAVVTNSSCTGSNNYCGTGSFNVTPTNTNASRVNSALSQLDDLITQLETYNTGTPGTFGVTGTIDVETTPGALKIYRNTSNYSTTGSLVLNCGTGVTCNDNSLVLIILAGSSNTISRNITLDGGLTADQVLFYVPTGTFTLSGSTTVSSNFVIGSGASTIGNNTGSSQVTIHGHLFFDAGAATFQSRGGSQDDMGPVPEPGTWAMMAGGFALMVWGARRNRKKRSDGE